MIKFNNLEKLLIAVCAVIFLSIILSCNVVKSTKGDSNTFTIIDTVRISIVDTTKTIIETLDFQNKVIEKYDTVYNRKDSLLIVLKERTVFSNGKKKIVEKNNGKSYDSFKTKIEYREVVKWKEKDSKRFPVWAFFVIGIMCLLIIIILLK